MQRRQIAGPAMTRPSHVLSASRSHLRWTIGFSSVALILVVLGGVWIRFAASGGPIGADQTWHHFLALHRSQAADTIAFTLNSIGGPLIATILIAVLTVVLLLAKRLWEAAVFAVSAALATAASELLKIVIARPRAVDETIVAHGFSYPSGHTTMAAVAVVATALLVRRWWVWLVGAVWVALMAWSRTYLLVHWLSDTIAGAVLGASVVVIVWCSLCLFLDAPSRARAQQPDRS